MSFCLNISFFLHHIFYGPRPYSQHFITCEWAHEARVFFTGKPSLPILIFACKAGAHPSETPATLEGKLRVLPGGQTL
jgi:hypothetical protein